MAFIQCPHAQGRRLPQGGRGLFWKMMEFFLGMLLGVEGREPVLLFLICPSSTRFWKRLDCPRQARSPY